jgi:polar amino acid transport system substrate-binding protein
MRFSKAGFAVVAGGLLTLHIALAGCAVVPDRAQAVSELAPTGTLRAGINFGNALLTKRPVPGGEASGIAVDLSRELANRLGVPLAIVPFDTPGQAADAVSQGLWDVIFIAAGPERAAAIDFSPPYVQLEATYLVAPDSRIQTVEQVDRAGIRIGVGAKTAYELHLTRTLRNAELVRVKTSAEAIRLMELKQIDAVAALAEMLHPYTRTVPGSRVLPGHFVLADQAVGTPKGRPAGAQFLRRFVEDAKSSGLIDELIKRNGVHGVLVAPAASKADAER